MYIEYSSKEEQMRPIVCIRTIKSRITTIGCLFNFSSFLIADLRLHLVGRSDRPSVTFLNFKRFLHQCPCPTVRDCPAVYPPFLDSLMADHTFKSRMQDCNPRNDYFRCKKNNFSICLKIFLARYLLSNSKLRKQ